MFITYRGVACRVGVQAAPQARAEDERVGGPQLVEHLTCPSHAMGGMAPTRVTRASGVSTVTRHSTEQPMLVLGVRGYHTRSTWGTRSSDTPPCHFTRHCALCAVLSVIVVMWGGGWGRSRRSRTRREPWSRVRETHYTCSHSHRRVGCKPRPPDPAPVLESAHFSILIVIPF